MAEGKYLNPLLAFIFILINLSPLYLQANPWLPQAGDYKFSASYGEVDKTTKKIQKLKAEIFMLAQDEIMYLDYQKHMIIKHAQDLKRPLLNSEKRNIETIKAKAKEIKRLSHDLKAFNDNFFSYIDLEYGINFNQSFGMKIGYKQDQTSNSGDPLYKQVKLDDKLVAMYYKYKFYDSKNFIATVQPKCYFSTHNNDSYSKYFDLSLLLGHAKVRKKNNTYMAVGLTVRTPFDQKNTEISYVLTFNEGIKFNNGIIISNFTEYERIANKKSFYNHTIYDQLAIAKEMCFDTQKVKCFTAQIGYFWKDSLIKDPELAQLYKMSGPIFSLWLTI